MERTPTEQRAEWRDRVIVGNALGATEDLPHWADRSYGILHEEVTNDAYPCFFGVQAERRGEMFYAFVPRGAEHTLVDSMAKFAELAQLPAYEKNNIAVFFEPDVEASSHEAYRQRFWATLQMLHDADPHPGAAHQVDPADSTWEFCYQGVEMFVVCACPSFTQRRSRNLGPGMVLLFQPRSVFIDKITNKVIGKRARTTVRQRLRKWDRIGAHPDLGFFGDPDNLEWKQYFLPDDNRPNAGVCPFRRRGAEPKVDDDRALTPAQQALWFLWQMDPDSGAYNLSNAIELDGEIDSGALRAALQTVVERHATLRMRFTDVDGVVRQRVDIPATRAVEWSSHDLRAHPERRYDLLRARGQLSFDLSRRTRLRATLLRVSATRWILQLCTHSIVADAWSLDLLQRESIQCYRALLEGQTPLQAFSLPLADEKASIEHDRSRMESDLAYWRERLSQVPDAIELPLDRRRPAHRSAATSRLSYVLTPKQHAGVRELASQFDTAPFAVILGAFALLLQRYSGQGDLCIAVPLRRDAAAIGGAGHEAAVGQFMNTAAIRLQVVSNDSFVNLVKQAHRYLDEARVHGELPFASLVQSLRLHRSLANTPLCQVMCTQLPVFPSERYETFRVQPFDDAVGRGQYDLSLNVAMDDSGAALFLDYSSALFHAGTAGRLLAHLAEILEQLTQSTSSTGAMALLQLSRPALHGEAARAA